ncbi:hypothetical protein BamMEX5DRAFT_6987 [Burkholderia ambifaria MEX-5]|uniref:Uncharacterized protein n=1 Tax=Burkholderia ambifaria MEX-5 TaxID=396597 RepID=B1TGS1_9BURK|nr:hypothetical protein BamMEX5DRAFT_6987 [Burkholderia ambifaria MEX-5]
MSNVIFVIESLLLRNEMSRVRNGGQDTINLTSQEAVDPLFQF